LLPEKYWKPFGRVIVEPESYDSGQAKISKPKIISQKEVES
jgi:hypothetical protein